MASSAWLIGLLSSRGLVRPDGRMLYEYRLTNDEFLALQLELHEFSGVALDSFYVLNDFSPLFVMFAAEWWRRKYAGGAWRWTPIVEGFGNDPNYFSPISRSDAVLRGLAYWGHRPNGEGKQYFGAIVAHGGLPLTFIGQKGGKLASIMAFTLRLAARYGWDEASVTASVSEQAENLPDSLRRREIYQLIAKMVLVVLELRQEFGLAGFADPLARLGEKDPKWQERFPLPLEDDAAQRLLTGLVREAATSFALSNSGIFGVERFLRKVDETSFQLYSSLACASSAPVESVAALFGFSSDNDLPRYFSIDVRVCLREPFVEARQSLGANVASVNFAGRSRTWQSATACAEHCMFIRDGRGDLRTSPLAIPGGQEVSVGEPWVFVNRDNKTQLVAVGSARVPEDEAIIMVPDGWSVCPTDTSLPVASMGFIDLEGLRLRLITVRGTVTLECGETKYRVRTLEATGAADTYAWEGKRISFHSSPNAVFFGVPKLYRYGADGQRNRMPPSQLNWYVAGTGIQIADSNLARGPVDVYVMRENERHTRFRFVTLDSGASIDFISGASPSKGAISFEDWSAPDISIVSQPDLECEFENTADGVSLLLRGGDIPPESVQVSLHWKRSPVEVTIALPFPSSGGRFFDSAGRVLRDNESLTLRNLTGARLRIFDRNPQHPNRYDLSLVLALGPGSHRNSGLQIDQEVRLSSDGSAELRLIDLQKQIESLMGFSNELDVSVDISLLVAGKRECTIHVKRYEADLIVTSDFVQFSATETQRLDLDTLEKTIVLAVPLTDLAAEVITLNQSKSEGTPTATWRTIPDLDRTLPWLIFPARTSSVSFRPTVFTSPDLVATNEAIDSLHCRLSRAIAHRFSRERLAEIAHVLDKMSVDFAHPSWTLIDKIWGVFNHLPLSSLDLFRALGSHPSAAAALLLRTELSDESRSELSRRLRDECGMVWELVSIDEWRSALGKFWTYWYDLLGAQAQSSFPIILKDRLNHLAAIHPVLKLTLDFLRMEQTGEPSFELLEILQRTKGTPLFYANELWRGDDSLAQTLLFRGHTNDANWPERDFFVEALQALTDAAPKALNTKSATEAVPKMLWAVRSDPKARIDHKVTVANLPILCALWVASGANLDWWALPQRQLSLRRIKAFDPIWFEQAFRNAFATCLAVGILVQKNSVVGQEGAVVKR